MGEGVVGPATVSMQTSQLYSCTGVAMVNRATELGGLYHYPTNTLDNQNVSNTLTAMVDEVRPDEIALTPAKPMEMGFHGTCTSDSGKLADELRKKVPGANVHELEPGTLAGLSWKNGNPLFGSHGRDDGEAEVPSDYRGTMATHSRPLQGGARYFGGDGEVNGVLDQDAGGRQRSER